MAVFGQALSEHPLATHAVGEVVGGVLEQIDQDPDLAVIFVSADHAGAMEDIVFTVRELLRPRTLVGTTGGTVVGGSKEVEQRSAISLWAAKGVEADAVRLRAVRDGDRAAIVGWPGDHVGDAAAVLLIADPFTFPTEAFLTHVREHHEGLPIVGGLASAGQQPGTNRLVVDGNVVTEGAVAAILRGPVRAEAVVSQGCRPIGDAFVVTGATGNVITSVGGEPPLQRLEAIAASLPPDQLAMLQQGVHLGLAFDEHQVDFGRGDFLIRNLVSADRDDGSVVADHHIEVGTTVQFQVRDAASADDDLRHLLRGRAAEGALLFTCNGRGTHLFDEPDHDASVIEQALHSPALAGMSCMGEIGPVGGTNYLHGFTASMLLFDPA